MYKSELMVEAPFSFMRLILASWVPFSLQSAQCVCGGTGRQYSGGSHQSES